MPFGEIDINGVILKNSRLGFKLSTEKAADFYGASMSTLNTNLGIDTQDAGSVRDLA